MVPEMLVDSVLEISTFLDLQRKFLPQFDELPFGPWPCDNHVPRVEPFNKASPKFSVFQDDFVATCH